MRGPFFTTAEVAAFLDVHEKQVYRLIKRGLPATRATGTWLFPRRLVEAWVENSAQAAAVVHEGARAVVVAGEDDPLVDLVFDLWNAHGAPLLARAPCAMERGLSLLLQGQVDAVVVEHAVSGCKGSLWRDVLKRAPNGRPEAQQLEALSLGAREFGFAHKSQTLALHDVAGLRVAVRGAGSASRTLLEHRLLRAGLSPTTSLSHQPTVETHRRGLELVLQGLVDACFAPIDQAAALGLVVSPVAALNVELLAPRTTFQTPALLGAGTVVSSSTYRALTRERRGLDTARAGARTALDALGPENPAGPA